MPRPTASRRPGNKDTKGRHKRPEQASASIGIVEAFDSSAQPGLVRRIELNLQHGRTVRAGRRHKSTPSFGVDRPVAAEQAAVDAMMQQDRRVPIRCCPLWGLSLS